MWNLSQFCVILSRSMISLRSTNFIPHVFMWNELCRTWVRFVPFLMNQCKMNRISLRSIDFIPREMNTVERESFHAMMRVSLLKWTIEFTFHVNLCQMNNVNREQGIIVAYKSVGWMMLVSSTTRSHTSWVPWRTVQWALLKRITHSSQPNCNPINLQPTLGSRAALLKLNLLSLSVIKTEGDAKNM